MSLSAIATNLKMRGGGPYFMISRVLGPDFGGSIGITLYFAQAVSVAFYAIGFTEALFAVLNPLLGADVSEWMIAFRLPQIVASGVVEGLFFLSFKGADLAIKAQYFILALLLLGVASFVIGGFLRFDPGMFAKNQGTAFTSDIGFWTVFSIFLSSGCLNFGNMCSSIQRHKTTINSSLYRFNRDVRESRSI